MATGIPQLLILVYSEINIGKYQTVKHYKCNNSNYLGTPFTELLNISRDRNCAKSIPKFWVQVRDGKRWKKPRLTGLFETNKANVYIGDLCRKKHAILTQFNYDTNEIVFYVFIDYYTKNITHLINIINHWYKTKKRG